MIEKPNRTTKMGKSKVALPAFFIIVVVSLRVQVAPVQTIVNNGFHTDPNYPPSDVKYAILYNLSVLEDLNHEWKPSGDADTYTNEPILNNSSKESVFKIHWRREGRLTGYTAMASRAGNNTGWKNQPRSGVKLQVHFVCGSPETTDDTSTMLIKLVIGAVVFFDGCLIAILVMSAKNLKKTKTMEAEMWKSGTPVKKISNL